MNRTLTEPTYQGRIFRYSLPNGWSFRMAFSADEDSLHMEGLAGEFAGQTLDVRIAASRVGYGIYFLNWIKPDGGVVSHVHDYNTNTVHAFWAYEENGALTFATTTGTLAAEPADGQ
jgi:phenolic acid decarboxylase